MIFKNMYIISFKYISFANLSFWLNVRQCMFQLHHRPCTQYPQPPVRPLWHGGYHERRHGHCTGSLLYFLYIFHVPLFANWSLKKNWGIQLRYRRSRIHQQLPQGTLHLCYECFHQYRFASPALKRSSLQQWIIFWRSEIRLRKKEVLKVHRIARPVVVVNCDQVLNTHAAMLLYTIARRHGDVFRMTLHNEGDWRMETWQRARQGVMSPYANPRVV